MVRAQQEIAVAGVEIEWWRPSNQLVDRLAIGKYRALNKQTFRRTNAAIIVLCHHSVAGAANKNAVFSRWQSPEDHPRKRELTLLAICSSDADKPREVAPGVTHITD